MQVSEPPNEKLLRQKNNPSLSVVSAFIEPQDTVLALEFTSCLFSSMGHLKAWVDKTLYNLLFSATTLWKQLFPYDVGSISHEVLDYYLPPCL